jgi:hypothetical protein
MARTTRWGAGLLAALLLLSVLCAFPAGAVPRYSARYEQNCMLCHVNPTGGGMRSSYAAEELVPKELAMSPRSPEALGAFDAHLNKAITIGADFRNQLMLFTEGSALGSQQGFFPMQGDIHLAFQLDPKYLLYFKHGISNTYEFYYLGHVLPWGGYVKGGRFVPPYGWKFDDHTMFVRNYLGFAPPANSDAGIELGVAPKFGDLQVALVNGSRGSTLDNDRRLALSGLASVRFRVGPLAASVGVSAYTQPGRTEDFNTAGLFGSLNLWNLTWVGQADRTRRDPGFSGAVGGLVTSHELSWLVRQGVEALATYDFYDPNRDLTTGAISRWGIGAKVMPRPFVAAEVLYRRSNIESGRDFSGLDTDEGVFQLHLFY